MRLNRIEIVSLGFFLIFLVILPITCTSSTVFLQEMEWKAKIGDKKTYKTTKNYHAGDPDRNGDPYSYNHSFLRSDGDFVTITWQVGTTITYEIVHLFPANEPPGRAQAQISYDGIKKKQADKDYAPVYPVIDNQSYWETEVTRINDKYQNLSFPLLIYTVSLEGDIFSTTYSQESIFEEIDNQTTITKQNLKTGWETYHYSIAYYVNGTVLSETEKVLDQSGTINLPFVPFLCGLMLVAITLRRKRAF